jgi:hypothetical protein
MKECRFCGDAFVNVFEEDPPRRKDLFWKDINIIGVKHYMQGFINEYGKLVLFSEDNVLASRKIKFCPMCGRKIPKITVSSAELKRRKERGER